MKLKKLEIFGFKSFADRTVFEFEDDLSALVGPNGSGKSNVVDALKWVLGERSGRKLRGTDMASLIFSGSKNRKPLNFAEVRLTIDNSNGWLPVDYEEVSIKRRVDTDGTSDYFMNGESCRLKDIRGLLMDTGAGTTSYSFIEQGQIAQLLKASPTDRRAVFEEAAGINRFLEQKRETERRLDRVTTNLERVNDIVEELQKRLRSVKYQAGRARTYKKHTERLEELRLGHGLHMCRELSDRLERHRAAIEAASERRDEALEAIAAAEAELEQARARLEQARAELAAAREDLTRVQVRLEALEREADLNRRRARELESAIDELETRRDALQGRARDLAEETEEAEARLEGIVEELKEKSSEYEAARERADEMRRQVANAQEALEERKRAMYNLFQRESQLRNQAQVVAGERQSVEARRERLQNRREELKAQLERAETEAAETRRELEETETRRSRTNEELAGLRENIARAAEELDEVNAAQTETRAELSGKTGRRDVLRDLEERAEGVRSGVKSLLEADLPGLHGLVADLVDAPLEHAPAIDAALGDRVQAIVCDTADTARRALDMLDDEDSGRAELVVLDCLPATPSRPAPQGVSGRLSEMVDCAPDVRPAVDVLLGGTFLVQDAASAAEIASGGLTHCTQLVTPGGRCYGADAVWAGGTPETPSLVSRRSELAELDERIEELERKLEELAERKQACVSRMRRFDSEREDLSDRLEELSASMAEARSRCQVAQSRAEDLQEDIQSNRAESQALQSDLERLDERRQDLEAQCRQAGREREESEQSIEDEKARLAEMQDMHQAMTERVNALSNELATTRERHNSLQAVLQRLQTDARRVESELDGLAGEHEANQERHRDALQAEQEARAETARLEEERARLEESIAARSSALERRRAEIEDRTEQCQELVQQREALEERLHELRMAENETSVKMQDLLERTAEDYGVLLHNLAADPETWQDEPPFTSRRIREYMAEEEEDPAEQVAGWYEEMEQEHEDEGRDEEEAPRRDIIDLEEALALREAVVAMADEPETDWEAVREEMGRLKKKFDRIGSVNVDAISEQERLEARLEDLVGQKEDLEEARKNARDLIRELNRKSREAFTETFQEVRQNFQTLFRKLFRGGTADLVLDEEADDVLEAGVEITARPPGKETSSISLLSGGEQALTTVALLFAMFQRKPSPFCLLDEVDAPLDDSNVERLLMLLEEFKGETQFIMITHNKLSMGVAQVLYGLTMVDGVSQKLSVRFEEVEEQLGLGDDDLAKAG